MDRVEAAQDAGVERRGIIQQFIVDVDEVDAAEDAPGSGQRHSAVRGDCTRDLDARQRAGGPAGLATQISPQGRGLGFGDDEFDDRRRVQVDHGRLPFVSTGSAEEDARRGYARGGRKRRTEAKDVALRERQAATGRELLPPVRPSHRDEPGDRTTVRRDLDAVSFLDVLEELTGTLAQLANANRLHVLQGSTSGPPDRRRGTWPSIDHGC